MPTIWRFVDQPTASPSVFLDMNDGAAWKTLGGDFFHLPSPPLRRSVATNALTDGGMLTSAAYDLRTIQFTLELTGATEAAREAQMDALVTQLARPNNLLMYQSSLSTNPVFFRTLRSDDYDLNTQFIPGVAWRVDCTVMAEPFAIGTRRDLAQVTITNDPAAGTNPARWDMTGVVGDSPTPAFMRLQGLGAGGTAILSQRTVNNPTAVTVFAQAESATLGTDTSTSAAANTSGGSGTFTTFASNSGLVTRITSAVPTASSAEAFRGRYRVFVRAHSADSTSVFTLRYAQNPAAGQDSINGPQVTFTGDGTNWFLVDLGIAEFPAFATPTAIGYSGLAPALTAGTLALQAQRNSGTANLDLDYVYLMPADERMCLARSTGAVGYIVIDGPNDSTYGMASGSSPFSGTLAARVVDNAGGLVSRMGSAPLLVPGVTNRWHLLVDKATVTTTKTVDVSYWPRWREVATA
jgi:hypothetical protein